MNAITKRQTHINKQFERKQILLVIYWRCYWYFLALRKHTVIKTRTSNHKVVSCALRNNITFLCMSRRHDSKSKHVGLCKASEISCLFNLFSSSLSGPKNSPTLFQLKTTNLFSPKGQSVTAAISGEVRIKHYVIKVMTVKVLCLFSMILAGVSHAPLELVFICHG
jgi:hypothetical protein